MSEYNHEHAGALAHRSRRLIFNFISTNPGASLAAIKRLLEMNESTLKYHLHYLEKHEKIYSEHRGKQRCYYCKQRQRKIADIYPTASNQAAVGNLTTTQERLLTVIKRQPGVTQKELAKRTKLNKKSVSYNLKRLVADKLVWYVKTDGGSVGYEFITWDKLRNEMLSELVNKLLADEIDEEMFNKIKKKLESMDIDELLNE